MSKFRERRIVDARQIGKDGENIITDAGVIPAQAGQYAITDNGRVTVMDADTFNETYEPVTAKAKSAPKPVRKAAPAKPKPSVQQSAAERVAAIKATKAAAKKTAKKTATK